MASTQPTGAIGRLMEELGKLPGIGPKSAERITHFLLGEQAKDVLGLADALRDIVTKVHPCKQCCNLTEGDLCEVCGGDVGYCAKANRMTEQVAYRATWCVDRRFPEPYGIEAIRIEPGTVHAGDAMVEVGDGGDQSRPGLRGTVIVGAIVAARVKAQAVQALNVGDAAICQIGLGERACDALRNRPQPMGSLR